MIDTPIKLKKVFTIIGYNCVRKLTSDYAVLFFYLIQYNAHLT